MEGANLYVVVTDEKQIISPCNKTEKHPAVFEGTSHGAATEWSVRIIFRIFLGNYIRPIDHLCSQENLLIRVAVIGYVMPGGASHHRAWHNL